ncbi:MAG: response regulator, partial [Synergistaceae bacterium]|nr:response regulator [Synergistaceae bacterium]
MKILIVEDEASIAEVVSAYAKREGYETVTASDGLEALEIFDRDEIDLIILDLMLPKLNGEEVCRRIREKSSLPIIMLTAKSSESDVVYGLDTGANDYVSKP